jgi:SiaC family regulatory phosphoprotein
MENLKLEATKYTPEISLETSGVITLKGKSYPENTFEFYEPFMNWTKEYFCQASSPKSMVINIEITYFNSSSSKLFFDFFDLLDENKSDFDITVNWLYDEENESALEAGEDFVEDFTELKINLVKK